MYPLLQQWDDDLARMAKARVLTCNTAHDKCIHTSQIKWPGQNILWYWGGKKAREIAEIGVNAWFSEIKNAIRGDIESYGSS